MSKKSNLKCPSVDDWIKKMWCIYTMDYYSAKRKKKVRKKEKRNLDICDNMDGSRGYYAK